MKKNNFSIAILATALLLFIVSSCKKESTVSDYPGITISMPTTDQMIMNNGAVHIMGTATASGTDDTHLLHEVSVEVRTLPDSTVIFRHVWSTHDYETFAIDTSFLPNVTQDRDMVLVAQSENHVPKTTTVFVPFMVHLH